MIIFHKGGMWLFLSDDYVDFGIAWVDRQTGVGVAHFLLTKKFIITSIVIYEIFHVSKVINITAFDTLLRGR